MSKTKRAIPVFSHPIIETHCHLDYLTEASVESIVQEAHDVGVERIMTISVTPDNMPKALALAESMPSVYAAIGVHPHEAHTFDDAASLYLHQHAHHQDVVAIGEIGLDYHYDHCDRNVQKDVFAKQLEIATTTDMPVVIHTREADDDTLAMLTHYAPNMRHKGVVHSFTSGIDLALAAVDMGFCIGINGIVTFNKADNVREIVKAIPLSSLLLETDAPYLAPVPYRGRENAPKYIPFVAETIANVKGVDVEDVLEHTYQNALRTFFTFKRANQANDHLQARPAKATP